MSTAATVNFDKLESNAENSLAWVLWAKNARNVLLISLALGLLNYILRRFVATLTSERLNQLSGEQAREIKGILQQVHQHLVRLLRHSCPALKPHFLFIWSIKGLENSAEDLRDTIEDLTLADNPQFVELLDNCVQALSHDTVGTVAHM